MVTKHILVTGGSGKVGRAAVANLREHGYSVLNADCNSDSDVPTMVLDLLDLGQVYGAMEGVDAVVHLAAIPSPKGRTPEFVFQTNVMSTFNVLQAAAVLGVKKVVMASSLSLLGLAYAFRPVDLHYLPIDEAHPWLAQDTYGLSKIAGEELASGFARRYPDHTFISLRYTLIVEPDQYPDLIAAYQGQLAKGASILWTYLDVRDAAECIRCALEYDRPGHRAFYVAAPETFMTVPTLDLLERFYPNTPIRAESLGVYAAPIDCSAARQYLRFEPKYHWQAALQQG